MSLQQFKNVGVGLQILRDWRGESGRSAALDVAERRAAVCLQCEFNSEAAGIALLTTPAAKFIHEQMQQKEALGIKIKGEENLKTCSICDCYLPLKIHVPMETILNRTSEKTLDEFKEKKPECWMVSENENH